MCVCAPESQQLNVQADVQVGLQLLGLSLITLQDLVAIESLKEIS